MLHTLMQVGKRRKPGDGSDWDAAIAAADIVILEEKVHCSVASVAVFTLAAGVSFRWHCCSLSRWGLADAQDDHCTVAQITTRPLLTLFHVSAA